MVLLPAFVDTQFRHKRAEIKTIVKTWQMVEESDDGTPEIFIPITYIGLVWSNWIRFV